MINYQYKLLKTKGIMNILLTFKTFLQLFYKRNVYEKMTFFIAYL